MVRSKKTILLISLSIAILVFVAGIMLGYTLDNLRSNEILKQLRQSELNTESYLIHEAFIDAFGGDECTSLALRVKDMQSLVAKTGLQLTDYSDKSISKNKDFDYLKRKYFLLEIKFLTLIERLKNKCDEKIVHILFFYSKDDQDSIKQGYVLTNLNEIYGNSLIVLSIDKDYLDEPLIGVLKTKYGITETSTIIINGEVKKESFTSKAELQQIIEEKIK